MARHKSGTATRTLIWGLALLLIAATLMPLIVTNQWWVRVFIFPQAQITILLAIVLIAAAWLLDLRRGAPKLLLVALAASLIYQLQYLLRFTPIWAAEARTAASCPADARVRLLVLNVKEGNEQAAPVLDLVREVRPDLFFAVETDAFWVDALAPLRAGFGQVVSAPRDTPWGMMLFSRLPLETPEVRYLVDDYVPSIRTGVRTPAGGFTFYGMHPQPPLMHDSAKGDAEVIRAAREIGRSEAPAVLAGDLNDVPWGRTYRDMVAISGLDDPRVGRAFDATFMADNPLLRWPLDHALATPHFGIVRLEPLRDVGSDHFPLLAELCLTQEERERGGR